MHGSSVLDVKILPHLEGYTSEDVTVRAILDPNQNILLHFPRRGSVCVLPRGGRSCLSGERAEDEGIPTRRDPNPMDSHEPAPDVPAACSDTWHQPAQMTEGAGGGLMLVSNSWLHRLFGKHSAGVYPLLGIFGKYQHKEDCLAWAIAWPVGNKARG